MIIWGGGYTLDFAYAVNTGVIYDSVGDSWVPTSMEGAASERYDHSAVWTGTYMIVWGGWGPADLTPYLNNGGRFIYEQSIDDDGDGFSECQGDCNEADASVYPGATQICDGKNNDCNAPGWPSLAGTNEAVVRAERKLNPNVDFYSATTYYALGIPINLFTPIFAVSRTSGWTAHVLEQYAHNRLIRPRAEYLGPAYPQRYAPIESR